MSSDHHEIQRLLHLYCRYLDDADFERWAGLFADGRMVFHLSPDEPPIIFDSRS